jgi:hypothetical protein
VLRSIRLHRLVAALVVALAFLVSSVEVLLPELHDGDAGGAIAETVIAPCAVGDVGTTMPVSHVEAPGAEHDTDAPGVPLSHHGAHVDHCAHSHFATGAAVTAPAPASVVAARPTTILSTLESVDLPLHQRPPIA